MNYTEFKNRAQNLPIIFSRDLMRNQINEQIIRNQLERWHSKKLLIRLRRGVFLLNQNDRKINPSRTYIANQLYNPSYVSLEYALNYYGLIPERVADITSVTTRKTLRLSSEIGTFIYQHIKVDAFSGFRGVKDEAGLLYFIAEPEKAVVDFLYLNLNKFKKENKEMFEEFYRFQNVETLKSAKIITFAKLFGNNKLMYTSRLFCKFLKKEGGKK